MIKIDDYRRKNIIKIKILKPNVHHCTTIVKEVKFSLVSQGLNILSCFIKKMLLFGFTYSEDH